MSQFTFYADKLEWIERKCVGINFTDTQSLTWHTCAMNSDCSYHWLWWWIRTISGDPFQSNICNFISIRFHFHFLSVPELRRRICHGCWMCCAHAVSFWVRPSFRCSLDIDIVWAHALRFAHTCCHDDTVFAPTLHSFVSLSLSLSIIFYSVNRRQKQVLTKRKSNHYSLFCSFFSRTGGHRSEWWTSWHSYEIGWIGRSIFRWRISFGRRGGDTSR